MIQKNFFVVFHLFSNGGGVESSILAEVFAFAWFSSIFFFLIFDRILIVQIKKIVAANEIIQNNSFADCKKENSK